MNVFKVLEGTVPSTVESRIIAFLGCLSAQQSFILRVMSVIGTRGIEAELLEVRHPYTYSTPKYSAALFKSLSANRFGAELTQTVL